MIVFGAPYYCLELYLAYTGRQTSQLVLALAGGAAVAPSSLDPWIFLLFWANWNQPANLTNSRRLMNVSLPHKNQQQQQQQQPPVGMQVRRTVRTNTLATSSSSDPRQQHQLLLVNSQARVPPYTIRWNSANKRQEPIS